jgi:hypothetical protein
MIKRRTMRQGSLLLFFTCLLFQNAVKSQADWALNKDKNGIKIFSRKATGFKVNELKVECEFEGTISQLAAVLLDVNKQYEWVYKTAKTQLLKEISPREVLFYNEIECPWPFDNRAMIVQMTFSQNVATKVMTVIAKNVADNGLIKNDLVRIKYSYATWTVTPLANRHFKVEYRVQIDPGDGTPAWLLNLFLTNGPYESFMNLKNRLRLPQYEHAKLSFLAD